ncbi:hypothetical protein BJY21_004203 [Kineosphaera limosa]|uniref:Uncharacterized protein n=1 Tax=Kineosphaera limosa NBRC 100340 TaxID=1184609 RepID=K6VFX2_9MICO|nr:hypothetical protein [Kineosphaera limosa]NYE03019.1 hypothetical protein [Kineosphaera limosa]GAB95088.1 hypothetical protein KILIM_016_00280 [Kineosphaera limosa NBRC 100340]
MNAISMHRLARRPGLLAVAGMLALSVAACGTMGAARVQPMGSNPRGMATTVDGPVLWGAGIWCSNTARGVDIEDVIWQENDEIDIVAFSVQSFAPFENRMGRITATLEKEYPDTYNDRTVRGRCDDDPSDADSAQNNGAPSKVLSQLVLELRLADPTKVGHAMGLRARTARGVSAAEPVTVVLCPADMKPCEEDSWKKQ